MEAEQRPGGATLIKLSLDMSVEAHHGDVLVAHVEKRADHAARRADEDERHELPHNIPGQRVATEVREAGAQFCGARRTWTC